MSERPDIVSETVSHLTARLKGALESNFSKVFLEGEISDWKRYPSGHCYFTLKDAGAAISCVMFKAPFEACLRKHPGIGASLKDGAKVLLYGNVTVYAPRGNYQFVTLAAKLVGAGDLMQRYLELKAKLEAEGLFAAARKRPLPFLPRRIGIVTSEAGAVIHDMCTVLTRRFPGLEIRLRPALVQGGEAPRTIVDALAYFDRLAGDPAVDWRPDLLIVARGGGSFEDLFCFNDETLVRAVAATKVPVISAVGHETDFTLCDFAADLRAGTPSIAAEIAVPCRAELEQRLKTLRESLVAALRSKGDWAAQRLDQLGDALAASLVQAVGRAETRLASLRARLEPAARLAVSRAETRLASARARLAPAVRLEFSRATSRVEAAHKALALLSPYGVLARGYALVTDAAGRVVTDPAAVSPGDRLTARLAKGDLSVEVRP